MPAITLIPQLFSLNLFPVVGAPLTYLYNHRISGIAKTNSVITPDKRVSLFDQGSEQIIDTTMSQDDGKFNFTGIPQEFDGVALRVIMTDETDVYNAVIADNLMTAGINEPK